MLYLVKNVIKFTYPLRRQRRSIVSAFFFWLAPAGLLLLARSRGPFLLSKRKEKVIMKREDIGPIKAYESLTFSDNFMFCEILKGDPELCKEIVETILDVRIREIVQIDKEETVKTSFDGHGVRLDVYLEGDDAIYDIEMQVRDEGDLPKRSRYYQGILDTDFLRVGDRYNDLKKTYIIFICQFDLFGEGLFKYTFRNACAESALLELGDETTKVFVNTHGALENASPKMKEFIKYLSDGAVNGSLTERINERLARALRDEEGRAKYMTFEWALAKKYREGKEDGKAEGKAEGKASIIARLLEKATPEQLIELGLTKEDIEAAKNIAQTL